MGDDCEVSNFNGTQPRGRVRLTNTDADPNMVVDFDVTCLKVLNNAATIGAIVTNARGGLVTFNAILLFMTDSGKFGTGPDLFQDIFLFGSTLPDCGAAVVGLVPVIDGEIVVNDAL